ncbi:MAG TPA: xanthine dehydrogenase family protein subunit M, partial [Geminicoccaceae bacterium]|nr:xanthine dehydrogenase family protein subunit M [Geminicoccaceae bacterium]
GQTIIPTLKQRLASPSDVIDLGGVAELKGIRMEGDELVIGAMTTHGEVHESEVVRGAVPVLNEVGGLIGDPQVRNLGTIGGSIANNDPAADYPAALVALRATVQTDRRSIPADDFFTGMFETALEPGEIVTAVRFPKPSRAGYAKFRNPASRYAIVGVMVAETGGETRVAVPGAAPAVFRATEIEAALAGDFRPEAVEGVTIAPDGLNSDLHASAEYRAHLVKVMAKRAVQAAR